MVVGQYCLYHPHLRPRDLKIIFVRSKLKRVSLCWPWASEKVLTNLSISEGLTFGSHFVGRVGMLSLFVHL